MIRLSRRQGGRTLSAHFTVKTFIYLGDQAAAATPAAEGRSRSPQPARRRSAERGSKDEPIRDAVLPGFSLFLGVSGAGAGQACSVPRAGAEEPPLIAEPEPGSPAYQYEVGGRRDPFRSLLVRNPSERTRLRPPGLAGVMVDELELQGTIRTKRAGSR